MARQKNTIKKQIISQMKGLGIYRSEYLNTINIYTDMLHQYEIFSEQFEEAGYKVEEEYTNKAKATNMRKTPIYSAMEKLRMDLSTYSNLLCLNPKTFEKAKVETENKSKLASVLNKLE